MLLRIRHGEDRVSIRLCCELVVPFALPESGADLVDLSQTFDVADSDFIWRDPDHGAVGIVQGVDVERTATGYDGEFETQPGEARITWSWKRAQRITECAIDQLKIVSK